MTLTARGGAFLAGGAGALGVALAAGSITAAALGLTLLVAVALAALSRPPRGVEAERVLSHEATKEGAPVEVALTVRLPRPGGRIEIADGVPDALDVTAGESRRIEERAGSSIELRYVAEPAVPGRARWGPVSLAFEDALGLARHEVSLAVESALAVRPRAEDLREALATSGAAKPMSGAHLIGQAGLGSSFFALRPFQPGDALRDVNWRASARTGKDLVVNQRERESQAVVAFLVDGRAIARVGTKRANAWIAAARAVATIAEGGAKRRDRAVLAIYGPEAPVVARAGQDAEPLVEALLDHVPSGSAGLATAVDALAADLRPRSPVVVISHLLDDPTVEEALLRLAALGGERIVLAADGPALLEKAGDPAHAARAERARLLAALRARGAVVVEWEMGEPLSLAIAREGLA